MDPETTLPTPADDAERGVPRATAEGFGRAVVDVKAVSHWWTVEPSSTPPARVDYPRGVLSLSIVSACNPGGRRRPEDENADRDAALRARLDRTDLTWWPSINRAPDGEAETWTERSVAIADLPLEEAVSLAHDLHQAALFVWAPGHLDLVWVPRRGRVTADRRHATTVRRSTR